MSPRRLALLFVVLVMAAGVGAVAVLLGATEDERGEAPVEVLDSAFADPRPHGVSPGLAPPYETLAILKRRLESPRSSPDDVLCWLAQLRFQYLYPPPPPGAPLIAPRPGFPEDAVKPVREGDLDAYALKRGWSQTYLADVRRFRRLVERVLLTCLGPRRADMATGAEGWQAVNVRAAEFLGDTGNAELTPDLIRSLDKLRRRASDDFSPRFWDAAFAALARLGRLDALEWLAEEFVNTRSSPRSHVDQMHAAHQAMLLFDREQVPGPVRHEVVTDFIRLYSAAEALARQDADDESVVEERVFWNRIGPDAIRVALYFAFDPRGEDGKALDTMEGLKEWYRDHRDPAKPPWTND